MKDPTFKKIFNDLDETVFSNEKDVGNTDDPSRDDIEVAIDETKETNVKKVMNFKKQD